MCIDSPEWHWWFANVTVWAYCICTPLLIGYLLIHIRTVETKYVKEAKDT